MSETKRKRDKEEGGDGEREDKRRGVEKWRDEKREKERYREEIKRGKKVRGRKIILKCYFLKTIFKNLLKQIFSIVFFSITIENI